MKIDGYTKQQLIDSAEREILRRHLGWSGSAERKPSESAYELTGTLFNEFAQHFFSESEWKNADDEKLQRMEVWINDQVQQVLRDAGANADKKWDMCMILLDLCEKED